MTPSHHWIDAPGRASRDATLDALDLPPLLARVDAHERLRGPYTAGGALLRLVVPGALRTDPKLVRRHDIEIVALAPDLRATVGCERETLTSTAPFTERTRYYPRTYTTRLAHGVVDFLDALLRAGGRPGTLVVDDADRADATDRELLAVLLRRIDPAVLTVVVGTTAGAENPEDLKSALRRYAQKAPTVTAPPAATDPAADARTLAARFVASECLSPDPAEREAYHGLPEADRAVLHDRRADELAATGEFSLTLGAIPYHREHGSDPRGAGADALYAAVTHCGLMGFYDAVLRLGQRCMPLLDWATQVERCWIVTMKLSLAYSLSDRPDEAAAAYDSACAATAEPSVHLQAAYGRAMIYTRFNEPGRRDHQKAKARINTAIAIASLSPPGARRAYNLTFQENGLALIEMHLGDLDESLRLVTEGLARMNTELEPGAERLHRSVLMSNRAQLLARMRRPEAEEAYAAVIAVDPNHSEYYFERAALYRSLGRHDEAMADYATAIRLSPPYPEPHYNRADTAREIGNLELAEAEYSRVLELDPEFVDAYVNRAGIRYRLGDAAGAATDVAAGLAVDAAQPHLHCLRGLLASDAGDHHAAAESFQTALRLDPAQAGALANLGVLAYERGDRISAIEYFDRALVHDDDPAVRANRATALRELDKIDLALSDYSQVLAALAEPDPDLLFGRGLCLVELGDVEAARADFASCVQLGGEHAEESARLLAGL